MQNPLVVTSNPTVFAQTTNAILSELEQQHQTLREHYQNLPFSTVAAVIPLLLAACHKRGALSFYFNLLYTQTVHVRADLPSGAIHISVLFNLEDDEDDDDSDTLFSEYDIHGKLVGGVSCKVVNIVQTV